MLELAVVVLDPPADLGQPHQFGQHTGRVPSAARGMVRWAGLTRSAVNRLLLTADRFVGSVRVPVRQVISANRSGCSVAKSCTEHGAWW
ncbi:hypothetical protein ACFVVC_04535 [Pseudarthrobacter sp. NPDC058196]|uniref:hypothetical protein n=1 Tax=Pseudarthrobacter sp. NPDC058196 TaxID=3346376 RepID=UPI0036DD78ED